METVVGSRRQGHLWRSRWAAIGAAVAVALGGGGLFVANAASSVPSSVITIDPVRILDTRTGVGLVGRFQSQVSRKLQVTGPAVPAGATGLLANVTVVGPSAAGFLSVRPGDATGTPTTSSLNFAAGDIIPNSVQVALPTTGANAGQIDITYDAFGVAGPTTDVLIDVVGYLTAAPTSGGGSGSTTDPAVLARLVALEAAKPFAKMNSNAGQVVFNPGDGVKDVLSVTVTAPVAGVVTLDWTAVVSYTATGDLSCAVYRSTQIPATITEPGRGMVTVDGSMSGTQQLTIGAGQTTTFSLACARTLGYPTVMTRAMTAIFTPNP